MRRNVRPLGPILRSLPRHRISPRLDKYVRRACEHVVRIYVRDCNHGAKRVEKQMIETIYEELKKLGAVSSRTDFSEGWLGMEGSYFRGRRGREGGASSKALATCAARLRRHASTLRTSTMPQVRQRGDQYQALAESCVDELLSVGEN